MLVLSLVCFASEVIFLSVFVGSLLLSLVDEMFSSTDVRRNSSGVTATVKTFS